MPRSCTSAPAGSPRKRLRVRPPPPRPHYVGKVCFKRRCAGLATRSAGAEFLPLVPAKAGTQSQRKKELDSRLRGKERRELTLHREPAIHRDGRTGDEIRR